jgi:hypothetical protein
VVPAGHVGGECVGAEPEAGLSPGLRLHQDAVVVAAARAHNGGVGSVLQFK